MPLVESPEALGTLLYLFGHFRLPVEVRLAEAVEWHFPRMDSRALGNLRKALSDVGLDPALLDPTPMEWLREDAARRLLEWYGYPDAMQKQRGYAAKGVKAIAHVYRNNGIGPDHAELGDLALWLQRAEADVAAVMGEREAQ